MTRATRVRILWAVAIALLLGGTYVIVAYNAPRGSAVPASSYVH